MNAIDTPLAVASGNRILGLVIVEVPICSCKISTELDQNNGSYRVPRLKISQLAEVEAPEANPQRVGEAAPTESLGRQH